MDIQQTEKESLAAYVHQFKGEASRCKFDNDATTIRIFSKWSKNAHTVATKIYEKGPQNLLDTIREVEKNSGCPANNIHLTATFINKHHV